MIWHLAIDILAFKSNIFQLNAILHRFADGLGIQFLSPGCTGDCSIDSLIPCSVFNLNRACYFCLNSSMGLGLPR